MSAKQNIKPTAKLAPTAKASERAVESMQLWDPRGAPVHEQREVYERLLPLAGAEVLDLGCGKGDVARAIASSFKNVSVTGLEVDRVQHERNIAEELPANVRFELGGAERIPAADESYDIVIMMKSLHHVPADVMDQALREVRRVLRAEGLAYVVEPVFAGAFNEILRIFHDERVARQAAFDAIKNVVASGAMALVAEEFFQAPVTIPDFAAFEQRYIDVTHSDHRLTPVQRTQVRERFERHMTPAGASFQMPMRVDLLRKTGEPARRKEAQ